MTDGLDGLLVEERLPVGAAVGRLPHPARRGPHVVRVGIARDAPGGRDTVAHRADVAVAELAEGRRVGRRRRGLRSPGRLCLGRRRREGESRKGEPGNHEQVRRDPRHHGRPPGVSASRRPPCADLVRRVPVVHGHWGSLGSSLLIGATRWLATPMRRHWRRWAEAGRDARPGATLPACLCEAQPGSGKLCETRRDITPRTGDAREDLFRTQPTGTETALRDVHRATPGLAS
jgi:hypothetical protein